MAEKDEYIIEAGTDYAIQLKKFNREDEARELLAKLLLSLITTSPSRLNLFLAVRVRHICRTN
jgi:hypothetical protein